MCHPRQFSFRRIAHRLFTFRRERTGGILRTSGTVIAGGLVLLTCLLQPEKSEFTGRTAAADEVAEQIPHGSAVPRVTPLPRGDRNPVAVALSPNRKLAAVANHGSGSVTLVDLFRGGVCHEILVGARPTDLDWVDDAGFVVTVAGTDELVLVDLRDDRLTIGRRFAVGDEPRSVVANSDSVEPGDRFAWVALSHADRLLRVNLTTGESTHSVRVGGLPRFLVLAPNHEWLVVGCDGIGDMYVIDARNGALLNRRALFDDPANLGRPACSANSSHVFFPHIVNRSFPVDEDNIEKGWVIDNRLTRLTLPRGEYWEQSQVALDTRGDAVGDANAVAISPDEQWLVVTCGGTHELLIFRQAALNWPQSSPGDFVASELLNGDGRFRRLKLGGRPTDVVFVDERTAVVANYFGNSLQIVDVEAGRVTATIDLGSAETPSAIRRGEIIFYDADRSMNSWFSCHTCHPDGGTNGRTFDTLNDRNFDTYKLTPSLRGVAETGPWTWHGWQDDLSAAIKKSMQDTMRTRHPLREAEVADVRAYLESLCPEPSPLWGAAGPVGEAARRGWATFTGKGGCAGCHAGAELTSADTYDVGTGSRRYLFPEFNPPSLRGLHTRRRFMHDGRAKTLQDLLTRHHRPEQGAGERLSDAEVRDLIEFLEAL